MPRRNYISKKTYKDKKRKLEECTKGFVDRLNRKMKREAGRQNG